MSASVNKLAIARFLAEAGRQAPSADNSQPFDFVWNGNTLSIRFSKERGCSGIFGKSSHATLLSLGAVVECVTQAADAAGVELLWHWSDIGDEAYVEIGFDKMPENLSLQYSLPLFSRHTNRFPFAASPIPDEIAVYARHQVEGSARIGVVAAEGNLNDLVRCVRMAAESRFCSEGLHNWLMRSLRIEPEAVQSGDGLDVSTLNLPPGGVQFFRLIHDWKRMEVLNRFGLFKVLAMAETQMLAKAPAIFCLVGKSETKDTIDAGRLLVRLWIYLNANGIAVHPYYVVTDQLIRLESLSLPMSMTGKIEKMRDRLPAIIGAHHDETLHMLLRVGLPKGDVPRSRRLPLANVFCDQS